MKKTFISLLVSLSCLFAAPMALLAQFQSVGNTIDPMTRNALDQVQRSLIQGNKDQALTQLQNVISSSGYIKELARFYYQLAQEEQDGEKVAGFYQTIIQNWPSSAYAQKAVIEVAPLILMSQGTLGMPAEQTIRQNEGLLLQPAADAASVGEVAEALAVDVRTSLIGLANFRKDNSRVAILSQQSGATANKDWMDLAYAYSLVRQDQNSAAQKLLDQWLVNYSNSAYIPFAMLALYQSALDMPQREQSLARIAERYPDSLEAKILLKNR